jgi:hypothetical protein
MSGSDRRSDAHDEWSAAFLHDIVYEIGWYSLAARHPPDEGDAVAQ